MGKTSCEYNWHKTGRQVFYDNSTLETIHIMSTDFFYDDFLGADLALPLNGAGGAESGYPWTSKIVGAAPPTALISADETNGHVTCSLTADDQKQDAAMYMDDNLQFSIAQGAIFETRVRMTVLPTTLSVASFGLWGAWGDGGSTYRVGFEIPAGGLVACESDDNATDTSASSGVTVTAAQTKIYRIDCTTQSNIKFYIDGVRVAGSTTFANAASTANSKCQPHLGLYKASGVGPGAMKIDYVKIWQDRA